LCSAVVLRGGELFEDTRNVERLHNQVALAMVDGLCQQADVQPRMIDVVAFGAGPGSFTGIRIAASISQGIALAAGALIAPVSSSLALASLAWREHTPPPSFIVTMTRSRRDAYYLSGFSTRDGSLLRAFDDTLCTDWPDALRDSQGIAVGERPPWWVEPDGATTADRRSDLQWGGAAKVTARLVAELGLDMYRRGDAKDPAAGIPIYVTGDSPWQPRGAS
jgi:tRNA threonylcarbamoyladenosine biosynthesis protein TsaB